MVAIGGRGAKLAPERAQDVVFGYAVGLDMTRRDLQHDMREKKRPWDIGKSFARRRRSRRSTASTPSAISARGVIWLDVNGVRRQTGDLADMIWDVPHTLSFLSQFYELLPGDLVFTGTPSGVGPSWPAIGSTARSTGSARWRSPSHRRSCEHRFRDRAHAGIRRARLQPSRRRPGPSALVRALRKDLGRRASAVFSAARPALRPGPEGNARSVRSRVRARRRRSCSFTAAIGARSTRAIFRLSRRHSSPKGSRSPSSTTTCVPTSPFRPSSTSAGERSRGLCARAARLAPSRSHRGRRPFRRRTPRDHAARDRLDGGGLARDPITGAVSVSGVHDLAPIVLFSYNVDLKLDAIEAARLSPVRLRPQSSVPLLLAVGADETPNFCGRPRSCGTHGPPIARRGRRRRSSFRGAITSPSSPTTPIRAAS